MESESTKQLPELTPENVEGLVNGDAPDLRMVDALVCREVMDILTVASIAPDVPTGHCEWTWMKDGDVGFVPHYTTDWAHGGPLFTAIEWDFKYIRAGNAGTLWYAKAFPPHDSSRGFEVSHPSKLVAEVCAWLIWKVKSKAAT